MSHVMPVSLERYHRDGPRPPSGSPARRWSAAADVVPEDPAQRPNELRGLLGASPAIVRLREQIARVAPRDVTVLIEGETGTGKELVARAIHASGARRNGAFVSVNCAELGLDAVESRLFGHRRGSFTGAVEDHVGFFETAHAGTLFLDEISDLAPPIQAKLLRALQEGEITRFGESRPRKVDVRVVAASNRDLAREVAAGCFRADLFHRLAVITIRVPPLRDRPEDILLLGEHFLTLHGRRLGVPVPRLSAEGALTICSHDFPGNVRELEHAMIRFLVLGEIGEALAPDVGAATAAPPEPRRLSEALAAFERGRIERALEESRGNRAAAARALGISRRWLLKRIEAYRLGETSARAGNGDLAREPGPTRFAATCRAGRRR